MGAFGSNQLNLFWSEFMLFGLDKLGPLGFILGALGIFSVFWSRCSPFEFKFWVWVNLDRTPEFA